MKHGKIIYDVHLGSNLPLVIEEVIQIANALNCDIHFKFNGTDLIVSPYSDINEIYKNYHNNRKEKK